MDIDQAILPSSSLFSSKMAPQDLPSLSPDSLYSYSLEEYNNYANNNNNNNNTDFSSADSPLSLGSPVSSVSPTATSSSTALPYVLSSRDDFDPWSQLDDSADVDVDDLTLVKPEPGSSPLLFSASFPTLDRAISVSPAIDPLQLSNNSLNSLGSFSLDAAAATATTAAAIPTQPSSVSPRKAPMPVRDRRYAVRKPSAAPRNSIVGMPGSLKRRSSSSASSSSRSPRSPPPAAAAAASLAQAGHQPPKKTAHNLIEKRYRTNLNDKILALRDSVPALRVTVRRVDPTTGATVGGAASDDDEDGDVALAHFPSAGDGTEDLGGLAPAHKLNKATILSKATEYIAHLERRNEALARENATLRSKVDGYEMLVMSRGGQNGVWA